jgi:hypothetical protein
MERTFIQSLIKEIPSDSNFFKNTTVIFPTKRACIYFKKALIEAAGNENIWLPEIISIQDFLYRYVPYAIATDQELIGLLFQIHQKIIPAEQSFAQFYKWGQMILKDFNEIDQYLVDTRHLFHYVKSFKTLDENAELTSEQIQLLNQFWNTLPTDKNSDVKAQFIKTWNALDEIYHQFRSVLKEKNILYEGAAYQALLFELENQDKKFTKRNFIIAGFNALSAFEERLFLHLTEHYNTSIYWDADTSYLQNEELEAGLFIRRYQKHFKQAGNHLITTTLGKTAKQVTFVEAPLEWTQVKYALEKIDSLNAKETVLVLCDETLLYPLLESLPESLPVNITMGYPLMIHPIHTLVQYLLAFHQHKVEKKNISPTLFLKIIQHPLITQYAVEKRHRIEKRVVQLGFVNASIITEIFGNDDSFMALLMNVEEADHVYLNTILSHLKSADSRSILDEKAFEIVLQILDGIMQSVKANQIQIVLGELYSLLKNSFSTTKLPFKSDSTDGIQIMGFLETRNLDFKNVIILGASENHLPGTNKSGSFIPYSIRKAMNLPTFHENDAIYGYHFYRLLQRAEDISLVYAIDIDKKTINPSRFIEQIKYEWVKIESDKIQFKELKLQIPLAKPIGLEPISISKNEPIVQAKFEQFFNGEKQISASSLIAYLRCPVQFYLKYIAEIPEPEELVEEYDQRILGLIFHSAMELFYQPFLKSKEWINGSTLETYAKNCDWKAIINSAFKNNSIDIEENELMGSNLLIRNIIQRLMQKVVQKDIELGEAFQIQGLELKLKDIPIALNKMGKTVFLKGTIDRIDYVKKSNGEFYARIVDYKSGGVAMNTAFAYNKEKPIELYMSDYFKGKDVKQGIQGYFYSYLFDKQFPNQEIVAGFYAARNLNSGLKMLRDGQTIRTEVLSEFERLLQFTLDELFDIDFPFIQTTNEKAYEYSAYKVLVE